MFIGSSFQVFKMIESLVEFLYPRWEVFMGGISQHSPAAWDSFQSQRLLCSFSKHSFASNGM
jgi:hypothetical protein